MRGDEVLFAGVGGDDGEVGGRGGGPEDVVKGDKGFVGVFRVARGGGGTDTATC